MSTISIQSDEALFKRALKISLSFYFLLGLVMGLMNLPEPKQPDIRALSGRVAKLILEAPVVKETPPIPEMIEEIVPPKPEEKVEVKPKDKAKKAIEEKPLPAKKTKEKVLVKRDTPKNPEPATRPSAERNREIVRKSGLLASFIEEEAIGSLSEIIEDNRLDEALSQATLVSALPSVSKKSRRPIVQKTETRKSGLADKQIAKIGGLKKGERVQLAKRDTVALNGLGGSSGNGSGSGTFGTQSYDLGDGAGVRLNRGGSGNATIDYDAIAKVVEKYKGGLVYLYNKELRLNPTLKGTIVVEFSIDENGKVVEATITTSTMDHAKLEKSLARRIKMWKFPKLYDGIIVVTYPFVFFPV